MFVNDESFYIIHAEKTEDVSTSTTDKSAEELNLNRGTSCAWRDIERIWRILPHP